MKITNIRAYLIEDPYEGDSFRWRAGLPGSGDGTRSLSPVGCVDTTTPPAGAAARALSAVAAAVPQLAPRPHSAASGVVYSRRAPA